MYEGRIYGHPLRNVWSSMQSRCFDENRAGFHRYGGRGITVCEEWRYSARRFISWALENGYEKGLQLDRRDNDGNYSPDNCRFVSCSENCSNRGDVVRLADGRSAWLVARQNGINQGAFWSRLGLGWSVERAVKQPVRSKRVRDGTWLVAEQNGVDRLTFNRRVERGWSLDRAATEPVRRRRCEDAEK